MPDCVSVPYKHHGYRLVVPLPGTNTSSVRETAGASNVNVLRKNEKYGHGINSYVSTTYTNPFFLSGVPGPDVTVQSCSPLFSLNAMEQESKVTLGKPHVPVHARTRALTHTNTHTRFFYY